MKVLVLITILLTISLIGCKNSKTTTDVSQQSSTNAQDNSPIISPDNIPEISQDVVDKYKLATPVQQDEGIVYIKADKFKKVFIRKDKEKVIIIPTITADKSKIKHIKRDKYKKVYIGRDKYKKVYIRKDKEKIIHKKVKKNSSSLTWDQINSSDDLLVRYPTIQVHSIYVSYDMFCLDDDTLVVENSNYTKQCKTWSNPTGERDPECLEYEDVIMETPLTYVDRKSVTKTHKLTVKAEVYMMKDNGENPEIYIDDIDYTVPDCN